MADMIDSKSDLGSSISELVSLGLKSKKLNVLNDSYEVIFFCCIHRLKLLLGRMHGNNIVDKDVKRELQTPGTL